MLLDPLTGVAGAPWFAHFDGDDRAALRSARGGFLWFQVGFGASAPAGWRPPAQWEGLGFIVVPTQRHSDPATGALAPVDEYGTAAGAVIATGFTSPRFLGEEILAVEGRALIADGAAVTTIDRAGARGWSWAVPEQKVETWAAWPVAGGALVRTDRRFTLLSPQGEVRWTLVR